MILAQVEFYVKDHVVLNVMFQAQADIYNSESVLYDSDLSERITRCMRHFDQSASDLATSLSCVELVGHLAGDLIVDPADSAAVH